MQACELPTPHGLPCPQEEPAAPRELGLGLGLGLKEKEEAVVAAAAGLEEASAAVAVGAGAAPAGPAVIGPSLPLALAMPLPEPEPLPLPLEVVRGLLPPLRIPELLSLRPRPRPPRPEPPPGLMALEVSGQCAERGQKGPGESRNPCVSTQEHSPLARGCRVRGGSPHTPRVEADLVLGREVLWLEDCRAQDLQHASLPCRSQSLWVRTRRKASQRN